MNSAPKSKPGSYYRPSEDLDDPHATWRQVRFAELLFNLQSMDGFETRAVEWRGHRPEALIAELESAYYMRSCGHSGKFVTASSDSARTHDFDVTLRSGLRCAWESKSVLESLEFDEKRLKRAIQDARSQLPKDIANVIYVRIPERWALLSYFEDRLFEPIDHLFRNSRERSISVLIHWEPWEALNQSSGVAGIEFINTRWNIEAGGQRVMERYSGFPHDWLQFVKWCERDSLIVLD